jgi:hypothetical protein
MGLLRKVAMILLRRTPAPEEAVKTVLDVKHDIRRLQETVDPFRDLLLDMEAAFKKRSHDGQDNDVH